MQQINQISSIQSKLNDDHKIEYSYSLLNYSKIVQKSHLLNGYH